MPIKEVISPNGQKSYRVTVRRRSPLVPHVRIQRSRGDIKTMAEAKRVECQILREVERLVCEAEGKGIPWGQLVDEWEFALRQGKGIDRPVGKHTREDYVAALRKYTKEWWSVPAEEISRMDAKSALDDVIRQGKSNARKKSVKNAINGLYRWAIENRRVRNIDQSPATGIKVSRVEQKKPEILTRQEICTLLKAAEQYNHPWKNIWAVALLTGMRSGELHALLWSDVDFENKRIVVSKSLDKRTKQVKCTKAGDWREVPISAGLERLLRHLKAHANGRSHVLPRIKAWDRGESARDLRAFCQGIGITPVKFHALRSCFATQLLRDKVAPAVVMKICGWKDLKTMQRYVRLAGIEIEGATDSLKLLPEPEVMGRVVELFKQT